MAEWILPSGRQRGRPTFAGVHAPRGAATAATGPKKRESHLAVKESRA